MLPVVQETGRAVSCYEERFLKGLHSFNHATDAGPGSLAKRKSFGVLEILYLETAFRNLSMRCSGSGNNTWANMLEKTQGRIDAWVSHRPTLYLILCDVHHLDSLPYLSSSWKWGFCLSSCYQLYKVLRTGAVCRFNFREYHSPCKNQ